MGTEMQPTAGLRGSAKHTSTPAGSSLLLLTDPGSKQNFTSFTSLSKAPRLTVSKDLYRTGILLLSVGFLHTA